MQREGMTPETETPSEPGPEDDVKMSLWEHLGELRRRLVRAALGVLVTTTTAWILREKILTWLQAPFTKAWVEHKLPGPPELQAMGLADHFVGYLQLSLMTGLVLAAPIIFYQLWAFISPGLYKKEKRLIFPFVFFSSTLFLSGVLFAYYVAFPFTLSYFFTFLGPVGESGTVLTQRPTMESYLDFITRMLLSFGCVFELPILLSFLVLAGIVTPKQLLRFSRWAVILAFVVGAIVTPGTDVSAQLAISLALIGLYFMSLLVAYFLRPIRKKA